MKILKRRPEKKFNSRKFRVAVENFRTPSVGLLRVLSQVTAGVDSRPQLGYMAASVMGVCSASKPPTTDGPSSRTFPSAGEDHWTLLPAVRSPVPLRDQVKFNWHMEVANSAATQRQWCLVMTAPDGGGQESHKIENPRP